MISAEYLFVGHCDATGKEELFNVAKTEGEAMVDPDRVANDFSGKAKPFVRRRSSVCCDATSSA